MNPQNEFLQFQELSHKLILGEEHSSFETKQEHTFFSLSVREIFLKGLYLLYQKELRSFLSEEMLGYLEKGQCPFGWSCHHIVPISMGGKSLNLELLAKWKAKNILDEDASLEEQISKCVSSYAEKRLKKEPHYEFLRFDQKETLKNLYQKKAFSRLFPNIIFLNNSMHSLIHFYGAEYAPFFEEKRISSLEKPFLKSSFPEGTKAFEKKIHDYLHITLTGETIPFSPFSKTKEKPESSLLERLEKEADSSYKLFNEYMPLWVRLKKRSEKDNKKMNLLALEGFAIEEVLEPEEDTSKNKQENIFWDKDEKDSFFDEEELDFAKEEALQKIKSGARRAFMKGLVRFNRPLLKAYLSDDEIFSLEKGKLPECFDIYSKKENFSEGLDVAFDFDLEKYSKKSSRQIEKEIMQMMETEETFKSLFPNLILVDEKTYKNIKHFEEMVRTEFNQEVVLKHENKFAFLLPSEGYEKSFTSTKTKEDTIGRYRVNCAQRIKKARVATYQR
ncbi:MAG: hypothetical protein PHI50_03820 [Alphaproteobacteria bacterium]|nr:hypothetical protein [Alphaproteobacteria bacterium]